MKLLTSNKFRIAPIILIFATTEIFAAACCGGGGASTGVITSDLRSRFSANLDQSLVLGNSTPNGALSSRSNDFREYTRRLSLSGASLVSDRFQVGAALNFQYRSLSKSQSNEDAFLMGDSQIFTAYEFLPELTYSQWKPKGFIHFDLTLPTGKSPLDAKSDLLTDVSGRGYTAIGVGTTFAKYWSQWIASFDVVASRFLSNQQEDFWGAQSSLGVAFSPLSLLSKWSVSAGLALTLEDISSGIRKVWTARTSLAYSFAQNSNLSLDYFDETLLASLSRNSILSRGFGVSFQQNFSR